MNKIVSALLAISVIASPLALASAASAAPVHHERTVVKKTVVTKDRWVRGHRLSDRDRHRAVSVDYHRYRLARPGHGQRWVRIDNRYLLLGNTGAIVKIVVVR